MKHWTSALALSAAFAAALAAAPLHAQDEAAPAPVEAEQPSAKVSGTFALPAQLPEKVNAKDVALVKLEALIVRQLPQVQPPFPKGFALMSDAEKGAWVEAFRKSPQFQEFMKQSQAQMMKQRAQVPVKIEVGEDGAFSVDGLEPGAYILQARVPHPKSERQSLAEYSGRIDVQAGLEATDLGRLELTVNVVLAPGDTAPEFTAELLHGGEIKLSDYRGKYVLIDFWATWCGPCIAEIPNLTKVYNEFGGDKFELVSLSLDANIDLPRKFQEKKPTPYVHAYLGEWNKTETTAKAYGVRGIPSIWLIGPDGKIVARDLRGEKLREAVRQAVEGEAEPAVQTD